MYDFFDIKVKQTRRGVEIFPEFKVCDSKDLMVRGRDFYAIWDPDANRWTTKELVVFNNIDKELYAFRDEYIKTQRVHKNASPRTNNHSARYETHQLRYG